MALIHAVCIVKSLFLKAILSGTFKSIEKIMSEKKYAQNFRTLRMLTEEVLRNILHQNLEIMDMLFQYFNKQSKHSYVYHNSFVQGSLMLKALL